MIGPGKYDAETTMVQQATNAAGVVLIIIDGNKGQGFSIQATLAVTMALPTILRTVADQLEADAKEMK